MMSTEQAELLLRQCHIVSCGTLRREIRQLAAEGLLDGDRVHFTAPGLHEWPQKLNEQLTRQVEKARAGGEPVIVVYGELCYFDYETGTNLDGLLARFGPRVARIRAKNCVDMLADSDQRNRIANGEKVYWLTTGWIEHWDFIFRDWDAGKANETFPAHEKGIVLDAAGGFEEFSSETPEKLLRICDWAKLPFEPHAVSLDRLRNLLRRRAEAFALADAQYSGRDTARGRGPE